MRNYYNLLFFIYGLIIVICDNKTYLKFIHLIVFLLGISFIIDFFVVKKRPLRLNVFLKIYFCIALLALSSSFWSSSFSYTFQKSMTLILIFANILIVYNINVVYKNYLYLVYGIFVAVSINFLWLLGLVDLGLSYEGWRFQGSVLQANHFVFILMFTLMMIIYILYTLKRDKIFKSGLLLLFLMTLYMVFFTGSKSGLMTSLILTFLFAYLMMNIKNVSYLFMIVFGLFILVKYTSVIGLILKNTTFDFEYTVSHVVERIDVFSRLDKANNLDVSSSTGDRIRMIKDAYKMWSNFPIIGNGIASFEIKYGRYSHNNIMELLVSLGLIGLLLYYSIYIYLAAASRSIISIKSRLMIFTFLGVFLLFDQSIVSYISKFKILALLILFLAIEDIVNKDIYEKN